MSHLVPPSILTACLLTAALAAQEPPAGFGKPDHVIEIGVLPGQLRYDQEKFTVGAGQKVQLTLTNTDEMQHNLLILKPGEAAVAKVAAAAIQLGPDASKQHYVPDIPEVLHHTKAISLGEKDTIWFVAPKEVGNYSYICTLPGHVFTMVGVMRVGPEEAVAKKVPIEQLNYRLYKGRWKRLPDFDALAPERSGELQDGIIDLGKLGEKSNFGACFTGVIEVAKAGNHTFFLNSDDGSRLLVGGKTVVEYDGLHGPAKEQVGKIELAVGRHPLRIEFFQGGGGRALRVAHADPDGKRRDLSNNKSENKARITPIMVHHHPVVMRVHVEGAAARTIAVGLPGGMNYCFDAQACSVQFGWAGAYLDVGPDRDGRGGRPCKTLGKRFEVGNVGFPLRTADGKEMPVRFKGYRPHGTPTFLLDWGGQEVRWSTSPAPAAVGLRYTFELPGNDKPLQFHIDRDGRTVAASAGTWRGSVLTVPAAAAGKFHVTVSNAITGGK